MLPGIPHSERWRLALRAGFAAVFFAIAASLIVGLTNLSQLARYRGAVTQSQAVATALQSLLSALQDAETGQRGFLVTGDTSFLAPYEQAGALIRTRMDSLRTLLAATPALRTRIAAIDVNATAKLGELRQTIDLWREGKQADAVAVVHAGRGKELMDTLRAEIDEIWTLQEADIRRLTVARARSHRLVAISIGVGSGTALLFLLLVFALQEQKDAIEGELARTIDNQRERLRVTLSSIGDGVLTTDATGRITFMNAVTESLTGYSQEEAIGRAFESIFVIVNEFTRAKVVNPITTVLERGIVVGMANHTLLIAKDGTERPIDDSAAPIRDASGKLVGVVLVFRDVTEARRREVTLIDSQRKLRAADARKDEFLAILSHELRGPLGPISNYLEIILRPDTDPALARESAVNMDRQLRQLVRLVDDLLDVNRVTLGKLELQLETMDLRSAVHQAVDTARSSFADKGIRLSLQMPVSEQFVRADQVRLRQVFANLLNNARKYTPQGGEVTVDLRQQDKFATIHVRDSGVGIPPDQLESIFGLFSQVSESRNLANDGLGIGLTLVRRLVEMHGGIVYAQSAGPGLGSEFVLRLPLTEAPLRIPGENKVNRNSNTPATILVVDDNHDNADSLSVLLGIAGHTVFVAYDGESGIDLASKHTPQVLVLDIGLPTLSGLEVCQRVREQEWGRAAVIIALSGWGQASDVARSDEAGFDAHLVKPVPYETLLSTIDRLRAARPAAR